MTPRCEANLPTVRVVDYGFEHIRCHQWRGLRTLYDAEGQPRYACPALGHLADVVRRFGASPDFGSEYGRLLAERDRLITEGADPADLDMPLAPGGPE